MVNKKYPPLSPNTLAKNDPRYQKWLISLKKRPPPWNKGRTKETDGRIKRMSETFKRRKIDNFANWRKDARASGIIPNTHLPFNKDENLSFLIGMILGDGNLQKISRTQLLNITLGTDKPLLWKFVAKTVEKVFNKKPTLRFRTNSKCLDIRIYQNNIDKRLEIPVGPKRGTNILLPAWIWKNKKYLVMCLKGLFEAEGSFSIHKETYTYNFSFSNSNKGLLNEVEKALIRLGFSPERRKYAVRLRKRKEALSFEKLISFRSYPLI